ncbi:MAG: G5 domain-containing protein [Armatimonadetes bacterium]|nr:G5 domain-containing protein [Armatimonadota bacterium]
MLKTETARVAGVVSAAALFSTAALSFPFVAHAQSAAQGMGTASPTPASDSQLQHAATSITLTDGPQPPRKINVHAATVAGALKEAGITLGNDDRVAPSLTTTVTAATAISITRVRFGTETETTPIPFRTVFKMSKDVPPGHIKPGHQGVPGILTKTFRVGYVNEKRTERWLVSQKVTRPPVDQETLGGIRTRMARALPSRSGTYNRLRGYTMTATGYSPYEGSSTGRCATGMRAGYGVVAVDPRVIRLGSRLYVEGYGYAVAGDTGGAIKGRRIDLGHTTYHEASAVGRRRVKVWVLAPSR